MLSFVAGLPDTMKPELLLMIPSMVDASEHSSAAEELLKCLSEKPDARFTLDSPLRLPATLALSMLRVNSHLTEMVLSVVMTVCSF